MLKTFTMPALIFTLFEIVLAFNQISNIVGIMNNAKLNQTSIRTVNALNKIELSFEEGELARDLDHAAFIALSEYSLGQLSNKVEFMQFKGFLIAVANRVQALATIMFQKTEGGFKTLRIDYKTYNEMERGA